MSSKSEVFNILDERIELLERKIERFEKFGDKSSWGGYINNAIDMKRLQTLKDLKNDFTYSVSWKEGE